MTGDDRDSREYLDPTHPSFKGERVGLLARLTQSLIFHERSLAARPHVEPSRYRRMWRNTVITVAAVSIIPLIAMTLINYFLYRSSFREEMTKPIERVALLSKRSVESFLAERIAAERYILYGESARNLYQDEELSKIFDRMRKSFGGIVDVGVIDRNGNMHAYAGPYDLRNKNYANQDWFKRMKRRDVYVSNVFLGHRKVPHFVIAVRHRKGARHEGILRATIDTKVLNKQISLAGIKQTNDAFIIDHDGMLQTPSRLFGPPLSRFPGKVPPYSESAEVLENVEIAGTSYFMAYAYVARSPFIIITLADRRELTQRWLTYQTEIVVLLSASIIAILMIIVSITTNWVSRIRLYEHRREVTLHKAEYNSKMASIGRLAAGVAHEINNPLAIINEKAGLMRDIIEATEDMPRADKLNKQIDSIIGSVSRCKKITHRLLGFARHIEVTSEPVDVDAVICDVIGFLEKEASHMRVSIQTCFPEPLPTIHSDKGQLQQLFLNLVNNALDAVDQGGHIVIDAKPIDGRGVEVAVMDDGCGISKENLERILEPFFTTKARRGTGLGLSICYGIVKKLGGTMRVESEVGVGTTFVIRLPVGRGDGEEAADDG